MGKPFFMVGREPPPAIEYGFCKLCGDSTIIVPATQTEDGLQCTDCTILEYRFQKFHGLEKDELAWLKEVRAHMRKKLQSLNGTITNMERHVKAIEAERAEFWARKGRTRQRRIARAKREGRF
jgi:hypothetical protein